VVGLRRAVDLALTNRVLTADEALAWGLVSRVVADDRLEAETEAIVATLAAGPTRALAAAKRLLRESSRVDLETQLAHEAGAMVAAGDTDDGREGVAAFVAKRRPEFTGR
jgi:2-(1,2-epoxy-1,2-dihydrophenyl)acetyl-CoA isomerase